MTLARPAAAVDPALIPPKPFQFMQHTEANFAAIGNQHLRAFRREAGLRPDADVLEIGSGNGRIARALTTYLDGGSYVGAEIMRPFVDWCAAAYAGYPRFSFRHIDVHNRHYNPEGRTAARDYRFPFPDGAFDFIYLTSVFTHMLRPEVENYLGEIARMLKPGGASFISYFLLDAETRALMASGRSRRVFKPYDDVTFIEREDDPEAAVAFDLDFVRAAYARAGLLIRDGHPELGRWRDPDGHPERKHNQDRIVATKPG